MDTGKEHRYFRRLRAGRCNEHSGSYGPTASFASMIYYNLDPEFTTLLFTVCSRDGRWGISVLPDVLCCCSQFAGSPLSLVSQAQSVGVQIIALGDHYANVFAQVRTGSIIFLVGLGSLVCWKLLDYWAHTSDEEDPGEEESPSRPRKGTFLRAKGVTKEFLSSFIDDEFVQDIDEVADDDPALIQGKYFGPDSPVDAFERGSPSIEFKNENGCHRKRNSRPSPAIRKSSSSTSRQSPCSSTSRQSPCSSTSRQSPCSSLTSRQYMADKSASIDDEGMSDFDHDSLPYDNCTEAPSVSKSPRLESSSKLNLNSRFHHFEPECRRQGDGSETPDSEQHHKYSVSLKPQYANYDSDEDWFNDSRAQPDGEEEMSHRGFRNFITRDISLPDIGSSFRQRSRRGFLSRDNSSSPHLSRVVGRDESISSNISEYSLSGCSDLLLEMSYKEDSIVSHTITSLADIEDELNNLKTSMIEMDEEVVKFTSKPNPYFLRTTFSEYSMDSDSQPNSLERLTCPDSLNQLNLRKNESSCSQNEPFDPSLPKEFESSSSVEVQTSISLRPKAIVRIEDLDFSKATSFEESGNKGEAHPSRPSKLRYQQGTRSRHALRSPQFQDEDSSLEWDNDFLLQYKGHNISAPYNHEVLQSSSLECIQEMSGFLENKSEFRRRKYLPDHSSFELDMETELLTTPVDSPRSFSGRKIIASAFNSSMAPISEQNKVLEANISRTHNPPCYLPLRSSLSDNLLPVSMTTSVDSAVHSASGSRSGSTSPLPQPMTRSLMSSGIGDNWQGISRGTPEESEIVSQLLPVLEIRETESLEFLNANKENENTIPEQNIESVNDNSWRTGEGFMGNAHSFCAGSTEGVSEGNSNNFGHGSYPATSEGRVRSIGEKVSVAIYGASEWNGHTIKAETIRKGYSIIPKQFGLNNLRQIRGDNYCGIRATLYQLLASCLRVPTGFEACDQLLAEFNAGATWLLQYSFGGRLSYPKEDVFVGFKECLDALDAVAKDVEESKNKEEWLRALLNEDEELDIKLCEAAKLHMLVRAFQLHRGLANESQVPTFASIMFARHSCANPREFLLYHLNPAGGDAGLEQIEMFLLGYAFGVTVRVVRPSSFGKEDFVCFFPDENVGEWPLVTLVAEDDRHYNILTR